MNYSRRKMLQRVTAITGVSMLSLDSHAKHESGTSGAESVARVLEILQKELQQAMALTGSSSIARIDQSFIWKEK